MYYIYIGYVIFKIKLENKTSFRKNDYNESCDWCWRINNPNIFKMKISKKRNWRRKIIENRIWNEWIISKILETNILEGQYNLNVLAPQNYPSFKKK